MIVGVRAVSSLSGEPWRAAVGAVSGVALLSFDAEMRFTSLVGGALASLGVTAAEVIGHRPSELFGGAGLVLEALCAQALVGQADERGAVDWAPGATAVYSVLAAPLRGDERAVVGGVLTLCDVTGERAREARMVQRERDLRAVIELSGDLLSRTDADGCYLYASPSFAQVLGYAPEELVGRRLRDFAHPDDVERFDAGSREVRETGRGEVEYRVRRADRSYVWVHVLLRARRDERGRLVEIVRAARDISAQRAAEDALARSERELRAVIEQSADVLSRHDAAGRFVYVSPSATRVTGYRPEELVGRHPLAFVHPEDCARVRAAGRTVRETGEAEVEHRLVRADGSSVWLQALARARRDPAGRVSEVVVSVRDMTERRQQETRLREAIERFERAFEHAPIGMALVGFDGTWLKVNRELCRITGYSEPQLLARSFAEITHPDDLQTSLDGLRSLQAGERFGAEKRYLHADGHVIWVHVACSVVCDERGVPQHFVAHTQDITERKHFNERLGYLADHDSLTDLYNRRRFEAELEREVSRSRRYGETAAVVMLDLDHFKYLNDALGHHVGDGAITHTGRVLAGRLRSTDVLARLGGDEYAVILPRVDPERACDVASELLAAIEQSPYVHDGNSYALSASAGVMVLDRHTVSAEDALVSADLAMHDAKQRGRNRVAVYSPDTRQDIFAGLSWSQRLKQALATDGFTLVAQPIVDLSTGETAILELLIRMRAEDGQLVPPARFLPAAARFGYMPAIDRWVIAQAAQLAAGEPGRRLAVNLAANTIAEPGLVAYITTTLAAAGADPTDLIFEVSESDVIANLDHARSVCERLRALGARIALDDFGSGFSGFGYLKALEIDLLKIDGQFVRELDLNRVDRLVIEAIVHVANGIDVPTIAEYVISETVTQHMRELGVTYGQGFHLGKPAPLAAPIRTT